MTATGIATSSTDYNETDKEQLVQALSAEKYMSLDDNTDYSFDIFLTPISSQFLINLSRKKNSWHKYKIFLLPQLLSKTVISA